MWTNYTRAFVLNIRRARVFQHLQFLRVRIVDDCIYRRPIDKAKRSRYCPTTNWETRGSTQLSPDDHTPY